MTLPAFFYRPVFWFLATVFWYGALWMLSSGPPTPAQGDDIPHFDKILHFGYFYGGAGLISAYLFRLKPLQVNWRTLFFVTLLVVAVVGASDEYHQSFSPSRSGNDPYDWLADILGGTVGAFTFRALHRILLKKDEK